MYYIMFYSLLHSIAVGGGLGRYPPQESTRSTGHLLPQDAFVVPQCVQNASFSGDLPWIPLGELTALPQITRGLAASSPRTRPRSRTSVSNFGPSGLKSAPPKTNYWLRYDCSIQQRDRTGYFTISVWYVARSNNNTRIHLRLSQ